MWESLGTFCWRATIRPAMSHLQRSSGTARRNALSDAFRVTKQKGERTATAVCEVWSHPFGWELRLEVDGRGLQMSSIVRSYAKVLETAEQWKAAMIGKGWE